MSDRPNRDQFGQPLQPPPQYGDSGGTGFVYGQRREQMDGYGQTNVQEIQRPNPLPQQMTIEDLRMLKDCNRESFWKRCLPFMAVANIGVHMYYTRFNHGATQARRAWSHMGFTIGAWFSGKLSYRGVCMNKIAMSTSNSPLAQKIRQRKGMNLIYSDEYVPPNEDPMYQELPADPVDPWGSSFSSAHGDTRQESSPGSRSSGFLDPGSEKTDPTVTYDNLREQNRLSYRPYEPVRR